jgi:hypothetical protein
MQEVFLIRNIYLSMLVDALPGRSFGIDQKFGYDSVVGGTIVDLRKIQAALRLEWFRIRHPIVHWKSMKAAREVVGEIRQSEPSLGVLKVGSFPFKQLTRDEYHAIVNHASVEQIARIMEPYRK